MKKIVWIHNFNREINPSAGIFMFILLDKCNRDGVDIQPYFISPSYNPIRFVKQVIRARQELKEYDYIHAQYGSATGLFTIFLKGKKILSLRGSDLFKTRVVGVKNKIHIVLGNIFTRFSIPRVDRIIVMSENMKALTNNICKRVKIDVIPDGINLEKFKQNRNRTNKNFRVLFSSVAEYNPVKRYHLAKEAFELFKEKVPESELVIMTGVTHDKVADFINDVDVVLLTSTHEGWPNIIKECMACNVPFVSTDVSDLKTISEKTEKCFVTSDNKVEISEALYKTWQLRNKDEDLRKHILQMDIDLIAEKIVQLYK